jgi:hypothetical protein
VGLGRLLTRQQESAAEQHRAAGATFETILMDAAAAGGGQVMQPYRGGMRVPGAWRCAVVLSDLLGMVPWNAYREYGGNPVEQIKPRPWLLEQPNPPDTRMTSFSSWALDLFWEGNAIGIVAARNATGYPTAAYAVPAAAVGVRRITDQSWSTLPIGTIEYSVGQKTFPSSDIIHIKGPCEPGALRGTVNPDTNNVQPRVGFAYQVNSRTVLRGGWAIYTVPGLFDTGLYQPGFSQATGIVPSLDTGVTIRATLANPFPDGVLEPPGSSLGPNTFLGRSIGRFNDQLDYRNGQAMRYALSVQRELPGQWLVEAAYVGNRGYDLTTDYNLNPVPREYLSTSAIRDTATINFLTANVANPFRGLLPGEGLNGTTAQRQQLLRPYPQFQNIDVRRYDGSTTYDSAQFRIERRFSGGYTVLTSYTWSDFKEKVSRLNETDTGYEERLNDTQLPHRLVVNGIWELPFGRGRKWGGANPVVNAFIGNWSVSAIWNWQSGRPNLTLGNVYYDGDITTLKTNYTNDPSKPVFDTSGFYFHDATVQTNGVDDPAKQRADQRIRLASNIRTLASRTDGLRGPRYTNWDMSFVKGFDLGRVRAQLHLELYNAFNDVFYNNPNLDPTSANFGTVSSQNNLPRNIQIGTKIIF